MNPLSAEFKDDVFDEQFHLPFYAPHNNKIPNKHAPAIIAPKNTITNAHKNPRYEYNLLYPPDLMVPPTAVQDIKKNKKHKQKPKNKRSLTFANKKKSDNHILNNTSNKPKHQYKSSLTDTNGVDGVINALDVLQSYLHLNSSNYHKQLSNENDETN
eukprot:420665_1